MALGRVASTLSISHGWFQRNVASGGSGGGIYAGGKPILSSVQVISNTAGTTGGGIFAAFAGGVRIAGTLLGNNRATNAGDGLYINFDVYNNFDYASLRNVTVASAHQSPHAAIQVQGEAATFELINTAVTSHTVGLARAAGSTLLGNYNAVFGNGANLTVDGSAAPLPFTNRIHANPWFVDPVRHDFHLQASSPLINSGDPNQDCGGQRDFEGHLIPSGQRANIGADEYLFSP